MHDGEHEADREADVDLPVQGHARVRAGVVAPTDPVSAGNA